MSEAVDRELEDEARALLRPAREPLAAPAEVRARALRRLALALPIGGGGGGEGAPPGTPSPAPGPAPSPSPNAGASGIARLLATRVPGWSLLVSFVAGGAIAVAASRPPADGARHEAPVEVIHEAAPTPITPAPAALPTVPPAPSAIAAVASAAAPASSALAPRPATSLTTARSGADGALEAERALLDVARTALGRGDGGNALRAVEAHGRKFPRGILAEEREAMSIQALRLLRRDDEAQARLERFRGRFPSSLMRPALEATDGGSP